MRTEGNRKNSTIVRLKKLRPTDPILRPCFGNNKVFRLYAQYTPPTPTRRNYFVASASVVCIGQWALQTKGETVVL